MVRLILLIALILFVVWLLRPFLKNTAGNKNQETVDRKLDPDQSSFRQQKTYLMVMTVLLVLAILIWILPKFGINFFALLQKIIPIISSLRGILPF